MKTRILGRMIVSIGLASVISTLAMGAEVSVKWLDATPPGVGQGVSWGVPWPRGAVKKDEAISIKSADGKSLPLQSWPMAYWPDGSIKWSGLASVVEPDTAGPFTVSSGAPAQAGAATLKVNETSDAIEIDTGALKAKLMKQGPVLIDSLSVDGKAVAQHGQLEC